MGGTVRTERCGAIGQLIFDHPERRNAISSEMWSALPDAVAELGADPAVRVIVMRGAGDVAFVSGADISEFESQRTAAGAEEYDARSARAFGALIQLEKPLLAALHGFCVGGGLALALAADVRYAADDVQMAIPAARLGLGYGLAGIETLVQLVGPSAAKEIFFTAQRFDAAQALRMGLVSEVIPKADLDTHVEHIAARIAANAPLTLRAVKLCVREIARPPAARDLEATSRAIATCFASEDYREGVRAFLEKRRPEFRGR